MTFSKYDGNWNQSCVCKNIFCFAIGLKRKQFVLLAALYPIMKKVYTLKLKWKKAEETVDQIMFLKMFSSDIRKYQSIDFETFIQTSKNVFCC